MTAAEIRRGPHVCETIPQEGKAPLLLIEPLRFIPVFYVQGHRKMIARAAVLK